MICELHWQRRRAGTAEDDGTRIVGQHGYSFGVVPRGGGIYPHA
jgi:hypothetical protein